MNKQLSPFARSYVLLSGGIDSATCLAKAVEYHQQHGGDVVAISFDYGQRHIKETDCAAALCEYYSVQHKVLKAADFAGDTMLTNRDTEVPNVSYDDIKGISPTYVPFRNGYMLAHLTAYAQQYANYMFDHACGRAALTVDPNSLDDLVTLYFGAHAEDSKNWAYPDCTPEFIGAMSNAIYIGSYRTIRLLAPFAYSDKADIIRTGSRLKVPYFLTWSCYKGEEYHCGACPTCRARKQAFYESGVTDPTVYLDSSYLADVRGADDDIPF